MCITFALDKLFRILYDVTDPYGGGGGGYEN